MLTETCQIPHLRSQEVSKEILLNLVREDVAEFSEKFLHFQYATLEMFKGALNNYSMLKLRSFINTHAFAMYFKNVSHQYYATNQDNKPHILSYNCPKIGVGQCLSSFICHSFLLRSLFSFERQIKTYYRPLSTRDK